MPVLLGIFIVLFLVFVFGWVTWVIVSALVVGAIIGGLARLVIPGKQEIGILCTIVIGWIGSLGGGLLARHVFDIRNRFATWLIEIAVAAILVYIASSRAGNAIGRRNASLRW